MKKLSAAFILALVVSLGGGSSSSAKMPVHRKDNPPVNASSSPAAPQSPFSSFLPVMVGSGALLFLGMLGTTFMRSKQSKDEDVKTATSMPSQSSLQS